MPLPPDIISVSLFLCERTLQEPDGVLSAIRILDVFWIKPRPDRPPPIIRVYGCALIKAKPGEHKYKFQFKVEDEETKKVEPLGDPVDLSLGTAKTPETENLPTGASVNVELNIEVKTFGTSYLCMFLDGEEVARTPFSILPPQEPKKQGE